MRIQFDGRDRVEAGKADLTVGAIQSVTAAGVYIAEQQKFFAAQGLRVAIAPTTGSGAVMADLVGASLGPGAPENSPDGE